MNADLEKYRTFGGWVEKPEDLQAPLEGDVSADVVIIGAGFVGLSAALELAKQGKQVVLLEREFAGYGASGRNAGYLAGAIGVEYDLFRKKIGIEKAVAMGHGQHELAAVFECFRKLPGEQQTGTVGVPG